MLDPQRRDYVLDHAIGAGKLPQSRREHYRQMYDRDPAGTETVLAMLAPGLPGVTRPAAAGFNSPHTPELFPDLVRGQRGRHGPGTALASAPVPLPAQRAPAPAEGDTLLTPELVAGWSRQLFPESASLGFRPGRVTRAGD